MTFLKRISWFLSAAIVAASLAACGGGGGGGSAAGGLDVGADDGSTPGVSVSSDTGSVTLLATDAPTDLFSAINLTVIKAEIFGEDGRVTLFSGEKTFDLLHLEHVTEIFSVTDVPAGNYSKIRLTLESIELVFLDEGREPEYPRLPGNGKLDLNPRGDLYVDGDNSLTVELDFDAKKSIHIIQAGKSPEKFNFRPVVFIKEVEGEADTKLIRQSGSIANIDAEKMTFDLCLVEQAATPANDGDSPDCIEVNTNQGPASIFDEFANLTDFGALQNEAVITAVGRLFEADGDRVVLVADLVWLGDQITRTENIACSSLMSDEMLESWYSNLPGPQGEQGCNEGSTVATALQSGAKIYDEEGVPADDDAIGEGIFNIVDGYLDESGQDPVLKAVMVMLGDDVRDEDSDSEQEWEGHVGSLEENGFVLITEEGDRCVIHGPETSFYESGEDDERTNTFGEKDASILAVGQELEVYGEEDSEGCVVAVTILVEEVDDDEDEEEE